MSTLKSRNVMLSLGSGNSVGSLQQRSEKMPQARSILFFFNKATAGASIAVFPSKKNSTSELPPSPSLSWATHGAPRATGYHPTQDRLWWPAAGPWPSQSRLHPRPHVSHLSLPTPSSSRPTIMSFLTAAGHRGPI